MKIYDNDQLLAIIIKFEDIDKEKNFLTDNPEEFQIASFNLKKNEIILNHYHPKQERKIFNTSEMITLLEGKIKIKIFKSDNTLVHSEILKSGDSVAMFDGGHGIEIIEDSKFIESKQGPFSEDNDKIRF